MGQSKMITAKNNEAEIAKIEAAQEKAGKPVKTGTDLILPTDMQISEEQDQQENSNSFQCIAKGTIQNRDSKKGDSSYWTSQMSFNGINFSVLGKHILDAGEKVEVLVHMQRDADGNPRKSEQGNYLYRTTVVQNTNAEGTLKADAAMQIDGN